MTADNLRMELEVIASEELREELDAWGEWTPTQASKLAAYLRDEMVDGGMLSVSKAREAGHSLGTERREARALLPKLRPGDVS